MPTGEGAISPAPCLLQVAREPEVGLPCQSFEADPPADDRRPLCRLGVGQPVEPAPAQPADKRAQIGILQDVGAGVGGVKRGEGLRARPDRGDVDGIGGEPPLQAPDQLRRPSAVEAALAPRREHGVGTRQQPVDGQPDRLDLPQIRPQGQRAGSLAGARGRAAAACCRRKAQARGGSCEPAGGRPTPPRRAPAARARRARSRASRRNPRHRLRRTAFLRRTRPFPWRRASRPIRWRVRR